MMDFESVRPAASLVRGKKKRTMKKKLEMVAAILRGLGGRRGLIGLANTYDAAVETHESAVRRTNDAAVTARHLLWAQGSTAGGVAVASATTAALGTVDNIETGTGVGQAVLLLGRGATKKMVAGGEIAAGARVVQAAGGKVVTLPAAPGVYLQVGVALTGAGADNDILEINDHAPVEIEVGT
jgi:hypothetical protein